MSDPHSEDEVPANDAAHANADPIHHEETVEDEEKILAGRMDVNMPALLTKDVQGG